MMFLRFTEQQHIQSDWILKYKIEQAPRQRRVAKTSWMLLYFKRENDENVEINFTLIIK